MKISKKMFALIIALIMAASIFPAPALAAEIVARGECSTYVSELVDGKIIYKCDMWELDSDGTLTVSGEGHMGFYDWEISPWGSYKPLIKNVVIEEGVTNIAGEVFHNCEEMESISISSTVADINATSFLGCKNLNKIILSPDNETYITDDRGVLYSADMTQLLLAPKGLSGDYVIPESVTTLWAGAFSDCAKLETVSVPKTITKLPGRVFSGCASLMSVELPDNMTSFGDRAIENCTSLRTLILPESFNGSLDYNLQGCDNLERFAVHENSAYSTDASGALYNKNKTALVRVPQASTGTFTVPESVTSIANYAFLGCRGITEVIMPDSVTKLGYNAFGDCSGLSRITLSNRLTSIPSSTFSNCVSLGEVILPDSLTLIDSWAFQNCSSLSGIVIPEHVEKIGVGVFDGCPLIKSVNIPASVTEIRQLAFKDMSGLEEIRVSENNKNYTSDEAGVLYTKDKGRLLRAPAKLPGDYVIDPNVSGIESCAFYNCADLTGVTLPGKYKMSTYFATNNVFSGCSSLKNVVIEQGVSTLSNTMFGDCVSLESIYIPSSVSVISATAFQGCSSLREITVDENNRYFASDEHGVLYDKDFTKIIKAPEGLAGEYTVPDGVTIAVFRGCKNITKLNISSGVTTFICENCTALTEVNFADGASPAGFALPGCTSIESAKVPAGVKYIIYDAFKDADNLRELYFTGTAPSFYPDAFRDAPALTCYYPENYGNWPDAVQQRYHGDVTWAPYSRPIGDVTGDGELTNSDLIIVARYIVNAIDGSYTSDIVTSNADFNGDGLVTNSDLITAARTLVGII